jgi:putative ABC transport system substrate-binding protein
MQRREFVAGLASVVAGTAGWSFATTAQQKVPVIGYLSPGAPAPPDEPQMRGFHQGLGELGFVEGRNVAIDYRWVGDQIARLQDIAADFVRSKVDVIVARTLVAAVAAKAATPTMPIVFSTGADPVEDGLVPRLNRPGGNLTGAFSRGCELGPKRLQFLREFLPAAVEIAVLMGPGGTKEYWDSYRERIGMAAGGLGMHLQFLQANDDRECEVAFASAVELRASALFIATDSWFSTRRQLLGALARRYAIPTTYDDREFVASGGMMSYGTDRAEVTHVVGNYAGRILKGEKATDLPVQEVSKIALVINRRSAKALGIEIPESLLVAADEVIE